MNYAHPHGHVFYRKMSYPRPMISHGEGIYLWDTDGKRYIDGSGGPLVVNVGHGRTEVTTAMHLQLTQAAYLHATMFTSAPLEQYAAQIAQTLPLPDAKIYPLSSGSEVVEGAMKLARQIQQARGENGRFRIISRSHSYHGTTLGALAASGRVGMRAPYLPMMSDTLHIAPPYPYRHPASGGEMARRLEEAIQANGPESIAAFLAEPISGAGLGAVVPPADYWPAIRQICDRYGVLLIADEVLVGLGRTGTWWGIDHWGIQPDILVTSKGSAGGYFPFGFIAAKGSDVAQIFDKLGEFNHGGTFSHHAVGAAAALATLRIIQEERLVENAAHVGDYLGQKLSHTFGKHPQVGDIRGQGMFWALELVQNRETKRPFPAAAKIAPKLHKAAFDLGLIIYYSQGCADGKNGDVIMLGPPLITTPAQVDVIVELLKTAVDTLLP